MTVKIDARGKACPTPVILAKQAMDGGAPDITVTVDNEMAVQNLTRLAGSRGMTAHALPAEGGFDVRMTGSAAPVSDPGPMCHIPAVSEGLSTFFIGKDHIGGGDDELGRNLMKMFLYTLAQGGEAPRTIIFMNGGVRLPAGDEAQVVDSLKGLEAKGCEILVCGTCLNFYALADQLKVGVVSNMYDIADRLRTAEKVITL